MDKKQYHEQAVLEIQQKKEVKQEQIIKKAIKAINNTTKTKWDKVSEELINDIYSSLEETLSITLTLVKNLYKISNKQLDIKTLTYQKDGKNLEDRVKEYCESINIELELNETVDLSRLKNLLTYNLTKLLDTETMTIHNQAIYQMVKNKAIYVEIMGAAECNEECDIYVSNPRIPIGEIDALPPIHPFCHCVAVYYLKDEVTNDRA